jgi:hypothetical protein
VPRAEKVKRLFGLNLRAKFFLFFATRKEVNDPVLRCLALKVLRTLSRAQPNGG